MPRPKLHSDDSILDAAKAVLKRQGPANFTLNDVANEVGISRAALIQRFKNKNNLLHCVAARSVDLTREHLDKIPVDRSLEGLRTFLAELCHVMGGGSGFETNLLIAWQETRDAELKRLSQKRFALVREALAKRIPEEFPLPSEEGARLFQCILGGAAMQWLVMSEGRLDTYMIKSVNLALDAIIR